MFIKELDNRIGSLLIALLNIETGHHGFALTGESDYLEPNQEARKDVMERLGIVREMLGENPVQHQRLARLEALIHEKLVVSDEIVAARETIGLLAAQKLVATQRGKEIMDEARQLVQVMVTDLDVLLTLTNTEARDRRAQMHFALVLVLFGEVLVLVGAFVLYNREHVRRGLSEEKFGLVVEASPSALLLVGPHGRIQLVNAQAEVLFGYPRGEFLGQPVEMLLPERFRTEHPGHRSSYFANPKSRAMGAGRDLYGLRKDGLEVPVEIGLNPLSIGGESFALASIIDITERKRFDAALRESEERLSDLFDNTSDLIQSVSPDGKFLFVNAAWHQSLGYSEADLKTLTMFDIIHSDSMEHCKELFGNIMSGQPAGVIEARFRTKDGRSLDVAGNASCQFKDGQPVATRAIFHDVTERRKAETAMKGLNDSLTQQAAELAIQKERAEAADRLKSAFLATMSHELRTPLNSIIGFTGIMEQGMTGPINDEQKKQLGMVMNSSRHLLALINDVLDISKIEAGELKVESLLLDPGPAIQKCLQMISPMVEAKGLKLESNVEPGISEITSDPRRFEQILVNLLTNAVKFTDAGSVTLAAANRGSHFEVRVTDTGMGIAAEDLAKLFKPFHQVNGGLSRPHEGTGLGLSICKKLLHLLGGEITVESQVGKGSTFAFTLPLDKLMCDA